MHAALSSPLRGLRVALVHDYLMERGGAERVLAVFAALFPDAPIFTAVYDPRRTLPQFAARDIRVSALQRYVARGVPYRALFPLYAAAFEQFAFDGYDLVLSSTTAFAKGVITPPETLHVCFCHTPPRFLWQLRQEVSQHVRLVRVALRLFGPWLRPWDFIAAQRVDAFLAPSQHVAQRIRKYYRRTATVLPSPIDAAFFTPGPPVPEESRHFLVVARLLPYKRVDLAVEAFRRLGLPWRLTVVGGGPLLRRLARTAPPNVTFRGPVDDRTLRALYRSARALIVPGEEDFGLAALEAQACGRPVVAYGVGGACETVRPGETGELFAAPTPDALAAALERVVAGRYAPAVARVHALGFDQRVFAGRLVRFLARALAEHRQGGRAVGEGVACL